MGVVFQVMKGIEEELRERLVGLDEFERVKECQGGVIAMRHLRTELVNLYNFLEEYDEEA